MMMSSSKGSCSYPISTVSRLVIILLLIILQTIPSSVLATRNLLQQEYYPAYPSPPQTGYGEDKSGLHGSESRDSGSANGDRSPTDPTDGAVQMLPPTTVTSVSYNNGGSNNNNNQPRYSSSGDYDFSPGQNGGTDKLPGYGKPGGGMSAYQQRGRGGGYN